MRSELNENLGKYPYIEKHYAKYIDKFTRRNHPLINLLTNDRRFLKNFDEILYKLDKINNLSHLIKKSKNPDAFWSIISEMKVFADLKENVDGMSIIIPKNSSPDFKIRKSNLEITIEVKRLSDKYDAEIRKSLTHSPIVLEIDDISTIRNATTKSINGKQYIHSSAHLFVFEASGMDEDEFEVTFYSHHGLFYEKDENGQFLYAMISGVVGIFEGQTTLSVEDLENIKIRAVKGPRRIYFENPNASKKIPQQVLKEIGFQIFKP